MTLAATMTVKVAADLVSALDLASPAAALNRSYSAALTSGTGAGKADRIWHDQRTLAASASEDLDLAGSLVDALGGSAVFAKIKGIIVHAAAGNINNVLVGGVSGGLSTFLSPAATGIITLRPDATLAVIAGAADATAYVVTATTADLLHIANSSSGTPVTYDVIIIGTSA